MTERCDLTSVQRIRCEALACAVRLMSQLNPMPTDSHKQRLQDTLKLAERFERWIRGEDDA